MKCKYPDIQIQYGFDKIPVEQWLDMALTNRLEVLDIRMRWFVLNRRKL